MVPTTTTITWDQFQSDVSLLADKIQQLGTPFRQIVAITRGGLIPAGILSHCLNIKTIDTVCVGSYLDGEQQDTEVIFKGPTEIVDQGAGTLIIDDLTDTGKTASLVKETMYPEGVLAVVYAKPAGKAAADLYVREYPQDTWLIFPWEDGIT
jgi:xanthine phosphoribosyltransferase